MSDANKTIARRWFEEVWNQRREATIDELYTENTVAYGLGQPLRGPAAFRAFRAGFLTAFPDLHIALDDVIAEGDRVALRATVTGTHKTSKQRINMPISVFLRIQNGKLMEGWNLGDFMGMYEQLGVLKAPAGLPQ